ncbi:MAG: hypothetical protein FWH18_03105 [Marinilabiliaceae bacterium]|nr:hypothetical protein [Marinilabiliaceae bacterium]
MKKKVTLLLMIVFVYFFYNSQKIKGIDTFNILPIHDKNICKILLRHPNPFR